MKTLKSINITQLEERLEMSGIENATCIIISIIM